ncbi:phytoene dehydrogenase-like protein [Paenalcaligenes hominis]|uniref:Pyridine nucleotide-disulfide oxidoreductase domain-containing protein 2 n=1 Tax=Paenalcaligenes hominis TaxID=643674 RepID=A0ABX0WNY9_9BURK|nr:NAD(P)/FAD-dependent oxidoreductase [Paenalcaligenes hominis]NJB64975.1 phytoene dehydrogenase-like protein [Paenalcaligenes hominis]GGE57660.1 FAD-dependent oxidoreductase [Paenalcaligenes hominis]
MKNKNYDVVIIGSGLNSLVCALLLAKRGIKPLVLERKASFGGCIHTTELFPGYHHELMASWYPLFLGGGAYQRIQSDLASVGVEFLNNGYTTGVITPAGHSLVLKQDVADTIQRIDQFAPGDGQAFNAMVNEIFEKNAELLFGMLGNSPYKWSTFKLLYQQWRKRGLDDLLGFAKGALTPFRTWSQQYVQHPQTNALMAPWVLHSGLGPQDAGSALIGKLTFAAVVAGGMPVVKGGGQKLVDGFVRLIRQHGGELYNHVNVERILLQNGRAIGVQSGQDAYYATKAVVCNVTPTQLYGVLLHDTPLETQKAASTYRYGRGAMQIHLALKEKPQWADPEMINVPLLHLATDLDQVSLSVMEAECGLIPRQSTIAVGQPVAVDPSRAPEGGWILWLQIQDMPRELKGDAANQIAVGAEGWTPEVKEHVANRIINQLAQHIPNLDEAIIGRHVLSPYDLSQLNVNLVDGDIYSGACSLDQFFWFRPFAKQGKVKGHHTPVANVYHIGASTHPGPGLGGGSGLLVADLIK